ncbi:hypothetical protein A2U01_0045505, partial [Trifolium medium]|nr:hypothetical protein [Trifolium medium]
RAVPIWDGAVVEGAAHGGAPARDGLLVILVRF